MSNKIPGALAPEAADRLLDLLANDDKFRELFARDPVAALVQVGYSASDEELKQLRSNVKVGTLASKEAIASGRSELRSSLISKLCMHPIQLNTGTTGQKSD